MTNKTYDSKCRDLADAFLRDYDFDLGRRDEFGHLLAIVIQTAIEDFFDDNKDLLRARS